jgi:hypothetical protein
MENEKVTEDMVSKELDRLRNLDTLKIMYMYGQAVLGNYPSMARLQALHVVIAARGISDVNLSVSLQYKSNGEPYSLSLVEM